MYSKHHKLTKFARAKGFTLMFLFIGFGGSSLALFKTDTLNDRVKVIETTIVNPCVVTETRGKISKDISIKSSEECRKGLVKLMYKTSSNPERAIKVLGIDKPTN